MKSLVAFFIKKPIWANAVILLVGLFGGYSLLTMNRSFFPELDPKTILVNVMYPGASPQEMEEGVTIKIEQALRGIDGIDLINSTSAENTSMIRIVGLENADMDEVYKDVENAVSSINSFPQGAEKPIITRLKSNPMSEMVATIGLKGSKDLNVLKAEGDKIETDLYASGLISLIDLKGFPVPEIVIEVKENELLRYGIKIDEISLAIQQKNQDLTGGILRSSEEELIIRSRERTTDPKEISEIVVRTTPEGQITTIGDLATVRSTFSENSNEVFSQGMPAVSIDVKKTPDQDLAEITDFVKEYIKEYNAGDHPAKLNLEYEFAESLQDRIDLLMSNGMQGLLLVLLMLGIFLSTRLSVWVAFGIPFAFLGMFIVANFMGLTINMISLFGMILVVGILVDDGIVISENIYTHYEQGKSPFKAALDGTMEVMSSVFTSVLTTVASFSILLFVEKMEMMREMPIVVMLALGFSLLEAFIILPVHLASTKVLARGRTGTPRYKIRNKLNQMTEFLRNKVYEDIFRFLIVRYRAYVLLPLIFIFAIIVFSMSGLINFTFFPEIKPDRISLEIAFQQGTGKEITRHWLNQAEKMVLEANQELAAETGDTLLSEYSILLGATQNIGETGFHTGGITMMIEGEGKKTPVDSLISRIERKVNTIENTKLATNFFVGGGMNNFGKPIEFSISGNDGNQITNAKNRFKEYLAEIPLVTNIKDNEPLGRKEIDLKMKPEAEFYGLGIFEITKQIRQGIFGQESQRVIVGTDEVKIWVRYELSDREDEFDLNNIRIKSNDGKQILLSDLVTYTVKRGPVSLKRRDGRREIVVDASVTDPNQVSQINTQIVEEIIPKIQKEFPDVELIQRGQGERSDKALESMRINTIILLVIIVLIMALNFESVWQALLILLAIPAGVAGAMLGHSMVGIPVSILSAFGIIALIGILVNDAIVFLDTYNRNILDGMSTIDAVLDAAKSRFRPILLTSITTVAGLLPIIMETSFQAQFLIPMAVSIAFGLIFGTIFILFFFPMIILVHNDMRRAWHLIMNPKTKAIKDSGFDFEKEATGKGIKLLTRFTGTIYWYILVIGLIFGGVIVLKNGLMADETVVSQVIIGMIVALVGILIVVVFPMSLFNKGIQKLWRNQELPLGRDIEVALVNEKHEKEREIH